MAPRHTLTETRGDRMQKNEVGTVGMKHLLRVGLLSVGLLSGGLSYAAPAKPAAVQSNVLGAETKIWVPYSATTK